MTGWYHSHEGWFFRRARRGAVEIGRGKDFKSVETVFKTDASGWASVITHVASEALETGKRYEIARILHQGTGIE